MKDALILRKGFPLMLSLFIYHKFTIRIQRTHYFFHVRPRFDMEDDETEKFRGDKKDTVLAFCNFALIKTKPEEEFLVSDLAGTIRQFFGNVKSYNCGRKYKKASRLLLAKRTPRRYYINKGAKPYNRKRFAAILSHFIMKRLKRKAHNGFAGALLKIHSLYDGLEDFDEFFFEVDFFDDDENEYFRDICICLVNTILFDFSMELMNRKGDPLDLFLFTYHAYICRVVKLLKDRAEVDYDLVSSWLTPLVELKKLIRKNSPEEFLMKFQDFSSGATFLFEREDGDF